MRKGADRAGRAEGGFTLLEMLVALTLLGFILTAAFGGLQLGTRVWEASDARAAELSDREIVQRVLAQSLARVYPLVEERDDGTKVHVFSGRPDGLRFVAVMPPYPSVGGLYRLAFAVEEDRRSWRLTMTRDLNDRLPDVGKEDEALRRGTLLSSPGKIRFSYYGQADAFEEATWSERWDSSERLPQLVKLTIDGERSDSAPWPEIVLPVQVEIDRDCLVEAGAPRCLRVRPGDD